MHIIIIAVVIYFIIKAAYWAAMPDSVKQAKWEAEQRAGNGGLPAALLTAGLLFGLFFAFVALFTK